RPRTTLPDLSAPFAERLEWLPGARKETDEQKPGGICACGNLAKSRRYACAKLALAADHSGRAVCGGWTGRHHRPDRVVTHLRDSGPADRDRECGRGRRHVRR